MVESGAREGAPIKLPLQRKFPSLIFHVRGFARTLSRYTAQGQLLKDKLRDHTKKKKHHLRRGGTIADLHRTEESCQVHVLEGNAAQLREFKQPIAVGVNSNVQLQRELKTDNIDAAQLCKLANPIEVEIVKNMEHADQLRELQQPTMVRVTSDVQRRELKSDKSDTAQVCKLANSIEVEGVKDVKHSVSMEEEKGEILVQSSRHEGEEEKEVKYEKS